MKIRVFFLQSISVARETTKVLTDHKLFSNFKLVVEYFIVALTGKKKWQYVLIIKSVCSTSSLSIVLCEY